MNSSNLLHVKYLRIFKCCFTTKLMTGFYVMLKKYIYIFLPTRKQLFIISLIKAQKWD